MATWEDLVEFIQGEYRVVAKTQDEIRVEFEWEDEDRTQVMIIAREELDRKYEWVQILTPIGLAKDVNLHLLLESIGHTTIACGAAIMGDHVVLRHALPLENLDINEFTDPLALIAGAADNLEAEFWGGDNY
ncbi:hypothetical protein [Actinocrispum wychmicini]|uniref:YbjN domain-containing protein n=1 Tax=Actinocrispum wychmicini TaxID=1213861 RepID=A0A4R2J7I1_9PSEU|nr:hypothetical protein [Actinocrispum wychmicini]TCO55061.1 hypothetical protein EV192_108349 [Actinocrispum wychmicini]